MGHRVIVIAGHRPLGLGYQRKEGHHVATGQGHRQRLFGIGVSLITAPIGGGIDRQVVAVGELDGMSLEYAPVFNSGSMRC